MKDVNLNIVFMPKGPRWKSPLQEDHYRAALKLKINFRGINLINVPWLVLVKKTNFDPSSMYDVWGNFFEYKDYFYSISIGDVSYPLNLETKVIVDKKDLDCTLEDLREINNDLYREVASLPLFNPFMKPNVAYYLYEKNYIIGRKIMENIKEQSNLANTNYFVDLFNIELELSDFFTIEELKEIYKNEFNYHVAHQELFMSEVSYIGRYPYGISIDTFKNIILEYFGENNPNGIKGVNKGYLEDYKYNSELLYVLKAFLGYYNYVFNKKALTNISEIKYHHYFFFARKYVDQINLPVKIFENALFHFPKLSWFFLAFPYKMLLRKIRVIAKF